MNVDPIVQLSHNCNYKPMSEITIYLIDRSIVLLFAKIVITTIGVAIHQVKICFDSSIQHPPRLSKFRAHTPVSTRIHSIGLLACCYLKVRYIEALY